MASIEDYKKLEYQGKKLESKGFKNFRGSGYNSDIVKLIDQVAAKNREKIEFQKLRVATDAGQFGEDMILSSKRKTFLLK